MAANEHRIEDIEELQARLQAQAAEIERLQGELGQVIDRVSRRGLIKGLGLGGLVALGTTGAGLPGSVPSALAAPGAAVEVSDLAGEMSASMHITFNNGADLVGDFTATAVDRSAIEILYYQSDVKSPRDAATGLPTGRRQYQPIIIRKRIDKTSPLLTMALVNNQIGNATIRFYRQGHGGGGAADQFFTVQLNNISIASIQQLLPDVHKSSGEVTTPPIEEISLVFRTITWTITDGGISAQDDWSSPT